MLHCPTARGLSLLRRYTVSSRCLGKHRLQMAKRKASTVSEAVSDRLSVPMPPPSGTYPTESASSSRPSKRVRSERTPLLAVPANGIVRKPHRRDTRKPSMNPDDNPEIIDGPNALRASPDSDVNEKLALGIVQEDVVSDSSFSDPPEDIERPTKSKPAPKKPAKKAVKGDSLREDGRVVVGPGKAASTAKKDSMDENVMTRDPEAEGEEEADEEEIKEALSRQPPVNSDYLPLPWKGRLGYACLCTYLRYSNPPVFCSRTTRIASILEHRHPLKDPSQPEHATKNRPDKDGPADIRRGEIFVEKLGLANVRDIATMIRWNDRYNITFLRLSSEMFPFASHEEYGYKLAPFAADDLAEAGKVIASMGHRVTTHPGQFTQLGSPRKQVVDSAVRDLEYHDEMLSLLKLPEQQNRDAVIILHMGGTFGDKSATLDRFRENYGKLLQSIKSRLVLENDDMCYSVHDLLPICKELSIPLVLDFHHHNIIFDSDKIREGTKDIIELYDEIAETWRRKGIKQKMHYSEPTPAAITPMQRRKHNPRVASLPPCAPDMDLMIEAKDKEQAVFELMKTFKLPGFDKFNDMIPHVRKDDNKEVDKPKRKATPKKKKRSKKDEDLDDMVAEIEPDAAAEIPRIDPEEVGMGGPQGRVYWPPGMEHWLRPVKRVVKKKDASAEKDKATPAKKRKAATGTTETAKVLENGVKGEEDAAGMASAASSLDAPARKSRKVQTKPRNAAPTAKGRQKAVKREPTPDESDGREETHNALVEDVTDDEPAPVRRKRPGNTRKSARAGTGKVNYAEDGASG